MMLEPRLPHPRRGLTLVELAVVTTLLTTSLLAFARSVKNSVDLGATSHESATAAAAAHAALEALAAVPFDEVWARYNADPDDDPEGAGTAPGPDFAVAGLEAAGDDPDGLVGEYVLPGSDLGGTWELFEDVDAPDLGLPRDLDLDGAIDAADHASDYRVLPVRVQLRWSGATGERTFTAKTILCER